ncbi:MAG: LCP family protein [Acutalibacteraceae bacterium]|jgi:LCP family protein required for cell wall assembly
MNERSQPPYEVDEYGVRVDRPIYRAAQPQPEEEPEAPRPKRKRHIGRRLLAAALILALVLAAVVAGDLWVLCGRVDRVDTPVTAAADTADRFDPARYQTDRVEELPLMGDTADVTNILLVGIDGEDYEGRADTNMLVSIDKRTKTVRLVSLMRDTWVTLPGVDEDADGWDDENRLNAAYSYGGMDLHLRMIRQNFRLQIDRYVTVNFATFAAAIDALGGVDVECRGDEAERVPAAGSRIRYGGAGYIPMGTADGVYHMDGFQALQYARIRYLDADGDFSRTSRQRKLIGCLIAQAKEAGLFKLHGALYDALPQARTNMSRGDMMGLALRGLSIRGYAVDDGYRIPQDGMWHDANHDGMAVLQLDDKAASVRELHRYLYDETRSDG